jgi:hypothetical protein
MAETEFLFRRIVIACDPVAEYVASIDAAARLAAWSNAALRGLFVQDEALLHLTALPFIRHIGAGGVASGAVDEEALLHQFEAQAARLRAAIEQTAREHALGWSFDVVRGPPSSETLALVEHDLLVITAHSRPFAGEFSLDSRLLAAAFETQRPIFLVRSLAAKKDGIVALAQAAGPATDRAIAVAAQLAHAGNRRLTVLAAPAADESVVRARVHAVSGQVAARCRIERIAPSDPGLTRFADDGSTLVVDADPAVNDAAALKDLIARTAADILFLR